MKANLPAVTLICVDTTDKCQLAERAIEKSVAQANFGAVKFLTHDTSRKWAVKIPRLQGLDAYSTFCIRDLHRYVDTSFALIVQYDGYVLNGDAWSDEFLKFDYIGAPSWNRDRHVGNGGFSLRSKRLLQMTAKHAPFESGHPEDAWICFRHRRFFESQGIRFSPIPLAERFAFEGRFYDGAEWRGTPIRWDGSFGFHSWLTPLPEAMDKPMIFHHTGDTGDIIYSLPVIKSLGGGVLFVSPESRFPYPRACRVSPTPATVGNLAALTNQQDYIWNTIWTQAMPFSTDVDLNAFRECYRSPGFNNFSSLFFLHQKAFNVFCPADDPWLTVDHPVSFPGKPIVVNRTARFHNPAFPWAQLVQKYGKQMVFVGSPDEAQNFQGFGAPSSIVEYVPTGNLLDLARIIAGAKVFIGNQSTPLAIAHGLTQKVIVECWDGNSNCELKRPDAIYWHKGACEIPERWLL